jgi:glycosyltransferase involved in cell wall biosynthesis
MTIGHYAPGLGAQGGISTYVRRAGRAQAEAGHAVHYFARSARATDAHVVAGDDDLFEQARAQKVDVLHLHRPVDDLPAERVPTVRTMHGNQGSCPSGSRYLARKKAPCHRAYSVAGCLWGHLVDHCGSRRPHRIRANFRRIEHEQRQAAQVPTLTVSHFVKEQMVRSGCPADNLHVLRSPAPSVGEAYTPPPEGTPRFVFLGRIEPKKGVDWLLRAAARVERPIRVDIAGDGNDAYVRKMQALAETLGVAGRVTFHGWLESDAVSALMQAARAVVFPSVWHEPAGLITLEAAAEGRPVIAGRVGGIPEYALEDFALLADPHDEEALAGAIEQLAGDRTRAERMGRAGRRAAQTRFAISDFVETLTEIYAQAETQVQIVNGAPVGNGAPENGSAALSSQHSAS